MTMNLRLLPIAALVAFALTSPPASAQVQPLAGTGENVQPIGRIPLSNPNEVELAGDWAFISNDFAGLVIVNIKDPLHPFVEGKWDCVSGWGDIDISTDGNLAILTNAHDYSNAPECMDVPTAIAIIDTSDKSNPKLLSTIADNEDIVYVHTATLDRNLLYLHPQTLARVLPGGDAESVPPPHIPIYDISNPRNPVAKGFIEQEGPGLAHDTYIDHRPDGKTLMYAASIHTSDVFDITDPLNATMLQRTASPEITISHDLQPSWDRKLVIVDDEGVAGGQLDENVSACGKAGTGDGDTNVDSGSIHFYEAAPDGTFANDGIRELGSFNAPTNANTGACVAHVFWQAPDENRLTQAYYRTGAFVVDFEDPANPVGLGDFHADGGGNYWSNKPHNGFMYATNQDSGGNAPASLDILRYTGEGGQRWPATAGPAEIQRSARQGVPYVPIAGASQPAAQPPGQGVLPAGPVRSRSIGRIRFTARLARVPGRSGKRVPIAFIFRNSKGKRVGTARVRRAAGRRALVKVYGGAVVGRYTWTAKAGKRRLGRGRIVVKKARMTLAPHLSLSVAAR